MPPSGVEGVGRGVARSLLIPFEPPGNLPPRPTIRIRLSPTVHFDGGPMRRFLIFAAMALSVSVCGCKSVASPEKQKQAEDRREKAVEKANQDMMAVPNGEHSPFGS